jgi:hypothetical protein
MTSSTPTHHLTLADISDLRAYERERAEFQQRVIALKRLRRVQVGELMTFLFENRDTVRFQIQEMARVEKLMTDEAIQAELDVYNVLVPGPGQLCVTLFIELTSDALLRTWLPLLVGIESHVVLRASSGEVVRARPEEQHESMLTRDDMTSTVHYLRFEPTPEQIEALSSGPVTLAVDHPAYSFETLLAPATVVEVLRDLRGA